jgi:tetratricopeptide (TPR) repeat protein
MAVDDQRILENLIVKVQGQLEQKGKKILKCPLSEDDFYAYQQVKNFLESEKESACDGLLVTGLNMLIYRQGAKAIELLNTSRDAFSRFRLPIAFVVNQEILKRIMRGAPDLYNMRDMPDLYFEGKWAPDMNILASSLLDYSQHELTNIDLKIQLLEKQLKRTKIKGKINDDDLNNMVIPLLLLYLEQGNLKKMTSLYQRYIKGNEHRVKDSETLDRYQRKTAIPAQPLIVSNIQDEQDNKYIEDSIESRRHFIQQGEWDRAAEITFALESYLTIHGFPQKSMELLMELDGKQLSDKNRSIVYHQMGNLFAGFGNYDAALMQYQKSLEICEKIGDIKGKAKILHQIDIIYQLKDA